MPIVIRGKGNFVVPTSVGHHYVTDSKLIEDTSSPTVGQPKANEIVGIHSPPPEIGGTLLNINFAKGKRKGNGKSMDVGDGNEGGRIKFVF